MQIDSLIILDQLILMQIKGINFEWIEIMWNDSFEIILSASFHANFNCYECEYYANIWMNELKWIYYLR